MQKWIIYRFWDDAHKLIDHAERVDESTSSNYKANKEIMEALNKITNWRTTELNHQLSKLESIESSIINTVTNLASLKAGMAKLE